MWVVAFVMDAITLLKKDHETVSKLFTRFRGLGDDAHAKKKEIVDTIIRELSIHAAIEEAVLYPTVRQLDDTVEKDVLEALEEHHIAKWTLDELEGMSPGDERYDAKVTVLKESIKHHVEEEETSLFPKIRRRLSTEQLEEMGDLLRQAKALAPTHPHPRNPDEPPGNLTALVAGFLDRVRDVVTLRPADSPPRSMGEVARAAEKILDDRTTSKPAKAAKRSAKKTTKSAKRTARKATTAAKRPAKKATKAATKTARKATRTTKTTARKATRKATATRSPRPAKRATKAVRKTAKKATTSAKRATRTAKRTAKR